MHLAQNTGYANALQHRGAVQKRVSRPHKRQQPDVTEDGARYYWACSCQQTLNSVSSFSWTLMRCNSPSFSRMRSLKSAQGVGRVKTGRNAGVLPKQGSIQCDIAADSHTQQHTGELNTRTFLGSFKFLGPLLFFCLNTIQFALVLVAKPLYLRLLTYSFFVHVVLIVLCLVPSESRT